MCSTGTGLRLTFLLLVLLPATAPARAAEIVNCDDLDPDVVECADFSDEGVLEFDLALLAAADVVLQVQTSAPERTAGALDLRAYLYNDSFLLDEVAFTRIELRLAGGARFTTVGTVRDFEFQAVPVTSPDAVTALILPDPPLPATDLLELGALDPEPGALDWEIDVSDVGAGGVFTLRVVAVPEPGALAASACALVGLSALAARRRAHRTPPAVSRLAG